MFFRNLTLLRFSAGTAGGLANLADALDAHRLRPCGQLEVATLGFVPPMGGTDGALLHRVGDFTWLTLGIERKVLPTAVINQELQRKVDDISKAEGRRVGGRERKRLKEALLDELLTRAFVQPSRINAYLDHKAGWLVVDTAGRKAAEEVVGWLRIALGSFPALPLAPGNTPRLVMTEWLRTGNLPPGLALGDECELHDPAGHAKWRGRDTELDGEDVHEHLRAGMQVDRLGLQYEDRLGFVLGEDLTIRKLRFFDAATEQLGDNQAESAADELSARFALMTNELERLLYDIARLFAAPRPEDQT